MRFGKKPNWGDARSYGQAGEKDSQCHQSREDTPLELRTRNLLVLAQVLDVNTVMLHFPPLKYSYIHV